MRHCVCFVCFLLFPGGLPNCWLQLDGCGWLMMMGHSWRAVGCLGQAQVHALAGLVGVCVVVVLVLFVELYSGREHLYCLCVLLCWKGTRWMPWYAEPMKDVKGCVKPRGVVN